MALPAGIRYRHARKCAKNTGGSRQYAEQWLAGARTGLNLTRDLSIYKPWTVRSYAKHVERLYPAIGSMRLWAIEPYHLQDAANELLASGLSASSVRNTFDPVRKIFARAVREQLIAVNPTVGLELKAPDGHRDWVDRPERVARALPQAERGHGRSPSTPACASANCRRSAGQTSTSTVA